MRRFPPPWSVTDTGASWCVSDANGFRMVWFCYGRDLIGTNPDRLTRDEARRLALGFAKLPGLLNAKDPPPLLRAGQIVALCARCGSRPEGIGGSASSIRRRAGAWPMPVHQPIELRGVSAGGGKHALERFARFGMDLIGRLPFPGWQARRPLSAGQEVGRRFLPQGDRHRDLIGPGRRPRRAGQQSG